MADAQRPITDTDDCSLLLTFGLAAGHLLDFALLRAARSGALGLGGGFLAGGALELFAFRLVRDLFGVGHR